MLVSVSALQFCEGVVQRVSGKRLPSSQSISTMSAKGMDRLAGLSEGPMYYYEIDIMRILRAKPYSYYTLQMSSHPPCSRRWSWRFWQSIVTEESQCLWGVHSVTEAGTRNRNTCLPACKRLFCYVATYSDASCYRREKYYFINTPFLIFRDYISCFLIFFFLFSYCYFFVCFRVSVFAILSFQVSEVLWR